MSGRTIGRVRRLRRSNATRSWLLICVICVICGSSNADSSSRAICGRFEQRICGSLLAEHPAQSRLHLPRLAQPSAERTAEVEIETRAGGVLEVVGVEHVEDLDDPLELAAADVEETRDAKVPGEVLVLLPQRVALEDRPVRTDAIALDGGALAGALVVRAALLGYRLRRIRADAVVEEDVPWRLHQRPAVEAVPLVAVAPVVVPVERIGARVLRRERIALVVVIRLVEAERVVELELEVRVERALEAERHAIVL